MVKDNTVVLGGEITTNAKVDYIEIVRRVANKLGYTVDAVINLIGKQSHEINEAVTSESKQRRNGITNLTISWNLNFS